MIIFWFVFHFIYNVFCFVFFFADYSVEDVPVATETECEKSNGDSDQTTTECKLTLDKKEDSVAVADENVISNGIKSTTLPAVEEPVKNESAATLTEHAADETSSADDVLDEPECLASEAVNEQPEEFPLHNGLRHDYEKVVDEDENEELSLIHI